MSAYPDKNEWGLAATGWLHFLIFGGMGAVLLWACWYFDVQERFWVPLLAVYGIAAIAQVLGIGQREVNIQMQLSTRILAEQMIRLAEEHRKGH